MNVATTLPKTSTVAGTFEEAYQGAPGTKTFSLRTSLFNLYFYMSLDSILVSESQPLLKLF